MVGRRLAASGCSYKGGRVYRREDLPDGVWVSLAVKSDGEFREVSRRRYVVFDWSRRVWDGFRTNRTTFRLEEPVDADHVAVSFSPAGRPAEYLFNGLLTWTGAERLAITWWPKV